MPEASIVSAHFSPVLAARVGAGWVPNYIMCGQQATACSSLPAFYI